MKEMSLLKLIVVLFTVTLSLACLTACEETTGQAKSKPSARDKKHAPLVETRNAALPEKVAMNAPPAGADSLDPLEAPPKLTAGLCETGEARKLASSQQVCENCLIETLQRLATELKLPVAFHESVESKPCRMPPAASSDKQFDAILLSHNQRITLLESGMAFVYPDTRENFVRFEPPVEENFVLRHASASEVAVDLQTHAQVGNDGLLSVSFNESSHLVRVRAPKFAMPQIRESIAAIDREPAEALLLIEIFGTTDDVGTEIGRQIETAYSLPNIIHAGLSTIRGGLMNFLLPPSSLGLLRNSAKSTMHISTPLSVMHGKPATQKFGDSSGAGFSVVVEPRVSREKVSFDLKLSAAGFNFGRKETVSQELNTSADINDGQTILLAKGYIESKGSSRSGIVGLDMIPILGRLVTVPKDWKKYQHVLMTVSAKITRPPKELHAISVRRFRTVSEVLIELRGRQENNGRSLRRISGN